MQKRVLIAIIILIHWAMAESSLVEIIEADNECFVALSKSYKNASVRELECKTVHILAKKLQKYSNYRNFERIKLIKKLQSKFKTMEHSQKMQWILKSKEIKKNEKNLKRIVWFAKIIYFDVEINQRELTYIYAINKNNEIKIKTENFKLDNTMTGKSVELCNKEKEKECTAIEESYIVLEYSNYNILKIRTPNGTLALDVQGMDKKDIAYIAYEFYAQLYNKHLPSLLEVIIKNKELSNDK